MFLLFQHKFEWYPSFHSLQKANFLIINLFDKQWGNECNAFNIFNQCFLSLLKYQSTVFIFQSESNLFCHIQRYWRPTFSVQSPIFQCSSLCSEIAIFTFTLAFGSRQTRDFGLKIIMLMHRRSALSLS